MMGVPAVASLLRCAFRWLFVSFGGAGDSEEGDELTGDEVFRDSGDGVGNKGAVAGACEYD